MTFYENHATFPGARGGTWHLHHKPSREKPIEQFEAKPIVEAVFNLAGERGVDADRVQAEAREREETERARAEFHAEHQLTLV